MDHRQQYRQAQLDLIETFEDIKDEDLDLPTSCSEWTIRDILKHVTDASYRQAATAGGEDYDPEKDPRLGNDPRREYPRAAEAAWKTHQGEETLNKTITFAGAESPSWVALSFQFTDVLIHIWDIRRALSQPVALRPELVSEAIKVAKLIPEGDKFRGPGKPFGHVISTDSNSPQDKLLALTGRSPAWSAPTAV